VLTDQGLVTLLVILQTAAEVVSVMLPTSPSPTSSCTTILASTQLRSVRPTTVHREVATRANSTFVTFVCRTGLVLLSVMWLVRCNARLLLLVPAWRSLALILLTLLMVLLRASTCAIMCLLLGSIALVLLGRRTADRQIDSYIVSQKHDHLLDSIL
jgi:hypothetical protein